MRALIQKVSTSNVVVDEENIGEINAGLLVLLGVGREDGTEDRDWLIKKITQLRIFEDAEGKMNLSNEDIQGGYLVISQFTLYGSTKKGNRPSFIDAAPPDVAEEQYIDFLTALGDKVGHDRVKKGKFGAYMKVGLINEGPVTIWLDTKNKQ